jgi:predicted DNA-binding mobile mystery protein A
MKEKDFLRIEQLERELGPYRPLTDLKRPDLGWIRVIREALGMSSPQLARRLRMKAAQSVEDIQKDESNEAITLRTLRKVADALDCDLVYALVPRTSLQDVRRRRATTVAQGQISRVAHSMKLERQGTLAEAEQNELERRVEKLLSGNPRKLWD